MSGYQPERGWRRKTQDGWEADSIDKNSGRNVGTHLIDQVNICTLGTSEFRHRHRTIPSPSSPPTLLHFRSSGTRAGNNYVHTYTERRVGGGGLCYWRVEGGWMMHSEKKHPRPPRPGPKGNGQAQLRRIVFKLETLR